MKEGGRTRGRGHGQREEGEVGEERRKYVRKWKTGVTTLKSKLVIHVLFAVALKENPHQRLQSLINMKQNIAIV